MLPIRILIADDHLTFLNIATRYLGQQDGLMVVGTATDGLQLLALARQLKPQAALLDLAMPALPGLVAIARLRAEQPAVAIIALTLLDTKEYRQASLAAGADEFVPKARMTDDLPSAIRRAVRARATARTAAVAGGAP
jgi:DNA-binding NarL/FixJ family response regulator